MRTTTERELIEWVSIRWFDEGIPRADSLPRIFLIGDSIVAGHATELWEELRGRSALDYSATSKIVSDRDFHPDLAFMLKRHTYSLIVFNNGLHGKGIDDSIIGRRKMNL
jgi:hypothetical protein